jgi:hydantoinase/carbamoylase family amidase
MHEAGLSPRIDPAGNLIGSRRGGVPGRPAVVIGSHIDTVPNGGMFDGALGVIGGLEVLAAMESAGYATHHPVEVIAFSNEEKARFTTPFGGSAAMVNGVEPTMLEGVADSAGVLLIDAMRASGIDPAGVAAARRPAGFCRAYVELHIEQGGRLEKHRLSIGVVTAIVGISRARLTFCGRANHAGTTMMEDRRDALWAAAALVADVRAAALAEAGELVGTVGLLQVLPGAANVVPGEARMVIELRSADESRTTRVLDALLRKAGEHAAAIGLELSVAAHRVGPPVPMDVGVQDSIERAAHELGLAGARVVSWAGHDASTFAAICPSGMIFVPSKGGISHAPDECTAWEDVTAGVRVLAATVCDLDRSLAVGEVAR